MHVVKQYTNYVNIQIGHFYFFKIFLVCFSLVVNKLLENNLKTFFCQLKNNYNVFIHISTFIPCFKLYVTHVTLKNSIFVYFKTILKKNPLYVFRFIISSSKKTCILLIHSYTRNLIVNYFFNKITICVLRTRN